MSSPIFYFSGTGNSMAIARDLARDIPNTRIFPMAATPPPSLAAAADSVGLVFPVYMWGIPRIVARFADAIAASPSAYIWAVATYGGSAGATLPSLAHRLSARGLSLSAGFLVRMPNNYTPLAGALPKDKQVALFDAARTKVARIADAIRQRQIQAPETGNRLVGMILSRWLNPRLSRRAAAMDSSFRADSRCDGCGLCADICPVANIEMRDGTPRWRHRCEQCMACLQWCPREAIQFGGRTRNRRRYHHPSVSIRDMLPQAGHDPDNRAPGTNGIP